MASARLPALMSGGPGGLPTFVLPDGRDTGLLNDALLAASVASVAMAEGILDTSGTGGLDPTGSGTTSPIGVNLPPGTIILTVGLNVDLIGGTVCDVGDVITHTL